MGSLHHFDIGYGGVVGTIFLYTNYVGQGGMGDTSPTPAKISLHFHIIFYILSQF